MTDRIHVFTLDFSMQMAETQDDCSCFCWEFFLRETRHALVLQFLLLFKTL